jgi:hypothetical protein
MTVVATVVVVATPMVVAAAVIIATPMVVAAAMVIAAPVVVAAAVVVSTTVIVVATVAVPAAMVAASMLAAALVAMAAIVSGAHRLAGHLFHQAGLRRLTGEDRCAEHQRGGDQESHWAFHLGLLSGSFDPLRPQYRIARLSGG